MVGFPSTIFRIIYVTRMDQDTRTATLFDTHVDNTMASLHARHAGENNAKIDVEDEEKAKKETKGVDELREDDSEERRKRQKRKKKKRRRYSSSSDSDDTDNEARRSKKRRKKEKSKRKKKEKKNSKNRKRDDDSSSDEEGVRRSVVSGKKIQMRIDKTDDDLADERARRELLRFMNSSV
jgi:hypothetical protein